MNVIHLLGRVGKDPEVVTTSGGTKLCKVSLATRGYKKDETDWHQVTFFGKTADIVEQYVKKGDMIQCTGSVSYSENDGKYYTNINANSVELLGGKSSGGTPEPSTPAPADETDDLPF
jgi:single-strand DNA-binding protein